MYWFWRILRTFLLYKGGPVSHLLDIGRTFSVGSEIRTSIEHQEGKGRLDICWELC